MRLILASLCFSVIVVAVTPVQNGKNGGKAGVGERIGQVVDWSKNQGQKIMDANIMDRVKDQIPGRPKKTETEQQTGSKHPPVSCIQHCASLFGFVFESFSADKVLRFSEGTVIPVTKGIEVEGTQANKDYHSSLVNGHKRIPPYCKCEATEGFSRFLEDHELDIEIFNHFKKFNNIQDAVNYIYDGTVKVNEKHGAKSFTYVGHQGLMTLILAEMQKAKVYDPDRWMYPERSAINIA
nr:PREDICTED: uncharacterized protein LOC109030730 [Bemisia tabaci]